MIHIRGDTVGCRVELDFYGQNLSLQEKSRPSPSVFRLTKLVVGKDNYLLEHRDTVVVHFHLFLTSRPDFVAVSYRCNFINTEV